MQFFDQATGFRRVNKADFDKFVETLSPDYTVDVSYSVHPPIKSWNDFSEERRWPHSVVAFEKLTEESEYYIPEWARLDPT
ncbi:MAG TPA: hypothetical protein DEA96_16715 [Leptospiraceae bacterium]|nr:hypothetical protein [Spirochaetaceae bacterium]HBS06614.1 hypothetical protein [Leptospiraceae bacterium]